MASVSATPWFWQTSELFVLLWHTLASTPERETRDKSPNYVTKSYLQTILSHRLSELNLVAGKCIIQNLQLGLLVWVKIIYNYFKSSHTGSNIYNWLKNENLFNSYTTIITFYFLLSDYTVYGFDFVWLFNKKTTEGYKRRWFWGLMLVENFCINGRLWNAKMFHSIKDYIRNVHPFAHSPVTYTRSCRDQKAKNWHVSLMILSNWHLLIAILCLVYANSSK